MRLDRALATAGWSAKFPFASVRHLRAAKSDHSPILLMNEMESGPRRVLKDRLFRYEKMWETHESYGALVEETWKETPECATVHDLMSKLGKVAHALISWNLNTFGSVQQDLRLLRRQLG